MVIKILQNNNSNQIKDSKMQLRKSTKEATIRSKNAAEQAKKLRLEKRKNKLAKVVVTPQVHGDVINHNVDDCTESNLAHTATAENKAQNQPINEITIYDLDNVSTRSVESIDISGVSSSKPNPPKKLNRFSRPYIVEVSEAIDNGNITVLSDKNATYEESINNSIVFACGYENTYNSTQLESDSEEEEEEANLQSSHMIPDGSSGDEYYSTEE